MSRSKGFSLIEILVALMLITATSLALLSQQWQLSKTAIQLSEESDALLVFDNQMELGESLQ